MRETWLILPLKTSWKNSSTVPFHNYGYGGVRKIPAGAWLGVKDGSRSTHGCGVDVRWGEGRVRGSCRCGLGAGRASGGRMLLFAPSPTLKNSDGGIGEDSWQATNTENLWPFQIQPPPITGKHLKMAIPWPYLLSCNTSNCCLWCLRVFAAILLGPLETLYIA